jgi:hypothetical protein
MAMAHPAEKEGRGAGHGVVIADAGIGTSRSEGRISNRDLRSFENIVVMEDKLREIVKSTRWRLQSGQNGREFA